MAHIMGKSVIVCPFHYHDHTPIPTRTGVCLLLVPPLQVIIRPIIPTIQS